MTCLRNARTPLFSVFPVSQYAELSFSLTVFSSSRTSIFDPFSELLIFPLAVSPGIKGVMISMRER